MSGRVADSLRDLMRAQRERVEDAEEAFVKAITEAIARALHDSQPEPTPARAAGREEASR